MNFEEIKEKLYFNDGTYLRDIQVLNGSDDDWNNVIRFLSNQKFKLINNDSSSQFFMLANCKINVFHQSQELDLDSREFESMEDHLRLINLLRNLSKSLNKPIQIHPEMNITTPILTIYPDDTEWH